MNRNMQIEGLRGVACILVAFHHMVWSFSYNFLNEEWALSVSQYAFLGRFGVFIFLMISSYYLVENKPNKSHISVIDGLKKIKMKIIKLYKRLWIGYVLTITIIFVITKLFNSLELSVNIKTLILNYTMLAGLIPKLQYVDGAHWYIALLIYTTIVVSIIEFLFEGKVFYYLFWLIASIAVQHYLPASLRDFTGIVVMVICEKRLLYQLKGNEENNWDQKSMYMNVLTIIGALIYTVYFQGLVYFGLMLLANMIVALCLLKKINMFENKIMVWLGSLSLYIYLIHQKISYVFEFEMIRLTGKYLVLYAIFALVISITGGWIIKYISELISKKINNLRRMA